MSTRYKPRIIPDWYTLNRLGNPGQDREPLIDLTDPAQVQAYEANRRERLVAIKQAQETYQTN